MLYCTKNKWFIDFYSVDKILHTLWSILCAIPVTHILHTSSRGSDMSRGADMGRGSDLSTYCTFLDIKLQLSSLQMSTAVWRRAALTRTATVLICHGGPRAAPTSESGAKLPSRDFRSPAGALIVPHSPAAAAALTPSDGAERSLVTVL